MEWNMEWNDNNAYYSVKLTIIVCHIVSAYTYETN